jgi:hypothetical protein
LGLQDLLNILTGRRVLSVADVCQQVEIGDEVIGSLVKIDTSRFLKELLQSTCRFMVLTDIAFNIDCFYLGLRHSYGIFTYIRIIIMSQFIPEDELGHVV